MADKQPFKDLVLEEPARAAVGVSADEITDSPEAAPPPRKMREDKLGDKYRIIALLGQGGMGNVYKVLKLRTDQIVAVKVIRQGTTTSGAPYIVMEYQNSGWANTSTATPIFIHWAAPPTKCNRPHSMADLRKRVVHVSTGDRAPQAIPIALQQF